ncbi:hypothetical protein BKA62DRAFT_22394 [Auriculariales sp. MPI-PUGE-AT-0066]|nr:hypothetical protein BKA62DRAFT_22394 [Auriculariales sp. MPI-PUGE-AT-0066]
MNIPNRPRSDHDRLLDPAMAAGARRLSRWHPYAHSPAAQNAAGSYSFSSQLSQSTSPTNSLPTAAPLSALQPATYSRRDTLSSIFRTARPSPSNPSIAARASLEFVPVARAEPGLAAPRSVLPAAADLTQEAKTTSARCLVERAMNLLSSAWKTVEVNPLGCSQPQIPAVGVAACADSSHPTVPPPESAKQSAYDAMMYPYQSSSQHMPLNNFIHEVLRRSRTNFVTLQTALCYLEVVAAKLPTLVKEEAEQMLAHSQVQSQEVDDITAEPEAPHMPSPLLCPRRTFLAALLLASKFLQDRSYSNKAWAKLTGLPAREVGRCERALFACLEWRLWVGKEAPMSSAIDGLDNAAVIGIDAQYIEPEAREPLAPLRKTQSDATLASHFECPAGRLLRAQKSMPITVPIGHVPSGYMSPTAVAAPSSWMDVVMNPSAASPSSGSQTDGYDSSSQHSLSPGALSYTQSTSSEEYSDVATPPDTYDSDAGVASPSASTGSGSELSSDMAIVGKTTVSSYAMPQTVDVSGWS